MNSYGGADASVYGELPDPVITSNKMIIMVKAVSINPVDYKIKNGDVRLISGSKFPKTVGSDFAGIVKEVAPEIQNFKPGDRVYGSVSVIFGKTGALSELVSTGPKSIRHIPEGISFEEAASLPVAALTALNGLRKCRVTSDKNVLINGATGGVGHFAIQIAKAKGAHVTATCSKANTDLAKQLGADEVIGYSREELAKTAGRYDAILDAWGKMDYADVCRLLKIKGIYGSTLFFKPSSYFSSFLVQIIFRKKLTSSNMRGRPEDYSEIEKLFSEKKLKPVIENIFTLEHSREAFEMAERGNPRGKVIIRI